MQLVLDASAFLSGRMTAIPPGFSRVYTTSSVMNEVEKGAPARLLQNLISAGLEIKDPATLEFAREVAGSTGDLQGLSRADLSIIALAIELGDARVLTDDFRVQNVLSSAGIPFGPAGETGQRTITSTWKWTLRCKGCGRYFDTKQKNDECPVCGSLVRPYRRK